MPKTGPYSTNKKEEIKEEKKVCSRKLYHHTEGTKQADRFKTIREQYQARMEESACGVDLQDGEEPYTESQEVNFPVQGDKTCRYKMPLKLI